MEVFLSRSARFEPMIRARFQQEGLPGDLGYLALIESGYSSEAVSRSYAVGMWQFMRGTGKGYGLGVDSWVDERRDPVKATDAAARHLRDLRDRFGSLYLAAAAYNAGAGKVSRSLGKLEWDAPARRDTAAAEARPTRRRDRPGGRGEATLDEALADGLADVEEPRQDEPLAPDSTDITSDAAFFRLASTDLLAAETQDYVPKLIAAALIAKAPARYGFAVPAAGALHLRLDGGGRRDRSRRGRAARGHERGRDARPQPAVPPAGDAAPLGRRSSACPRAPAPTVAGGYAQLSPKARVHYLTHVTGRRERLSTIAARYHLPMREIQAANPKLKATRPAKGTRVVIPAAAVPSALAMRATGTIGGGRALRRPAPAPRAPRRDADRHRPAVPGLGPLDPPRQRPPERSCAPCRHAASASPADLHLQPAPSENPVSADSSAPAARRSTSDRRPRPPRPVSERAALAVLGSMVFLIVALMVLLVQTHAGSIRRARPRRRPVRAPTAGAWRCGERCGAALRHAGCAALALAAGAAARARSPDRVRLAPRRPAVRPCHARRRTTRCASRLAATTRRPSGRGQDRWAASSRATCRRAACRRWQGALFVTDTGLVFRSADGRFGDHAAGGRPGAAARAGPLARVGGHAGLRRRGAGPATRICSGWTAACSRPTRRARCSTWPSTRAGWTAWARASGRPSARW